MIRDMKRNGAQPKDTMHKASIEMITGMGVVITDSTTISLPAGETATNVYFVTKERVPSGTNAARTDMSDYDEDFTKIKKNELVGLEKFTDGEKLATDQFTAADFGDGAVAGFTVSVGTDGKLKKATIASKYIFDGIYNDNGHKLVMVRVESDAITNA